MNANLQPSKDATPTLFEELNRKAFETLEDAIRDFDNGKITEAQRKARLDALWGLCAGLVSPEIMSLISNVRDKLPYGAESFVESRSIKDESTGKTRTVRWRVGSSVVNLYQDGTLVRSWNFKDEIIPSRSARELYDALCAKLDGGLKCG